MSPPNQENNHSSSSSFGVLDSPFLNEELLNSEETLTWDAALSELLAETETPYSKGWATHDAHWWPSDGSRSDGGSTAREVVQPPYAAYEDFDNQVSTTQRDSLLAIPRFADAVRTSVGTLLTPAQSRTAMQWNAAQHPARSGVRPDAILAALLDYVEPGLINVSVMKYNAQHPRAQISVGSGPVNAVFVEAIHQFQRKCYADSRQHDGWAGPSVLDSLGLWPRPGLRPTAQTNDWARSWIRKKQSAIEAALRRMTPDLSAGLGATTWWDCFVSPCYLGWGFNRPIHAYLARKLRQAERWLLSQQRFIGKSPVELANLLDIREVHAGGRTKGESIHTLGLGIDIKYAGNPHIGDYRDKRTGAAFFTEVMKRAVRSISGITLAVSKFPQWLHQLGDDRGKSTEQIYIELARRDQDLRDYLSGSSRESMDDERRLRLERSSVFRGQVARDPKLGFLNLDRELVLALRDHAGLAWGAVDFGPRANGDIMHFDCRLDELGRAAFCGSKGYFNPQHPAWRRPEDLCPSTTARESELPSYEGDRSECEDEGGDAIAQLGGNGESVDSWNEIASDEEGDQTGESEDDLLPEQHEELDDEGDELSDGEFTDEAWEIDESIEEEATHEGENEEPEDGSATQSTGKSLWTPRWKRHPAAIGGLHSFKSKAAANTVAVFLPSNLGTPTVVDILVYLHGLPRCGDEGDSAVSYMKSRTFSLIQLIEGAGRPFVLVVPWLGWRKGQTAHRLGDPARMNKLLNEVTEGLAQAGWTSAPTIGRLYLAGHSKAFVVLDSLGRNAANAASSQGGMARLCEVWSLDSMYSRRACESWMKWALQLRTVRFFVHYRPGTGTAHQAECLRKAAQYQSAGATTTRGCDCKNRSSGPVQNIVISPENEVGHCELVKVVLPMRLAAMAANPIGIEEQLDLAPETVVDSEFLDAPEPEDEGVTTRPSCGGSGRVSSEEQVEKAIELQLTNSVTFPSGESLAILTGLPDGPDEDFWDPKQSGNPLLDTGPSQKSKSLSANFSVRELTTTGGISADIARIDTKLVECLQRIRDFVGKAVTITSGYRSWKRNKEVYAGGTPTKSEHCSGRAADIKIAGMDGLEIAKAAIDAWGPNLGIGLGRAFAHVDVRNVPTVWDYDGASSSWIGEIRQYQQTRVASSTKTEPIHTRRSLATVPTIDIPIAIRRNRQYGEQLGWRALYDQIVRALGFTDMTPGEELFARAVAKWQEKQSMTVDGILGPNAWRRMQTALGETLRGTSRISPQESAAAARAGALEPYAVNSAKPYGPRWGNQRPPGLPNWARRTSVARAALPEVQRVAETRGLGGGFVRVVQDLALGESGASYALPAHTFDSRPAPDRPSGTRLITAWGVFQFNRDAWTQQIPLDERRSRRSWIGTSIRGCEDPSGCVFPWDANPDEEIERPIRTYATLFREIQNAGGSELDAARGVRLWHALPRAYNQYKRAGAEIGFAGAWQQVESIRRQQIDKHLGNAGLLSSPAASELTVGQTEDEFVVDHESDGSGH